MFSKDFFLRVGKTVYCVVKKLMMHQALFNCLTLSQVGPCFYVSDGFDHSQKLKSFENTVAKGEIAQNEQFLLFTTVFSALLYNSPPCPSNL